MCNDAALCALFSCLVGLWVLWEALTKLLNIIVKLLLLSHSRAVVDGLLCVFMLASGTSLKFIPY